jgi:hypothetical protein
MVEVEMGEHDVPNVARREAEPFDLTQRRLLLLEREAHQGEEKAAEARPRRAYVVQAQTGIDENQPMLIGQWQTSWAEARPGPDIKRPP